MRRSLLILATNISSKIKKICIQKSIPFHCFLELTYRCNLSCRHCYAPKDSHDELSLDEIDQILEQLSKIGTLHLVLTGGEILMRDDFFEITSLAKSKGFLIGLMTNGTLITPDIADRIANIKPIDVEISLYGSCEETHDYVTTVDGSFKKVTNAISYLVERGIPVTTKTVLMKCNAMEHKGIEELSRSLGATPKINIGIIPCKDGSFHPLKYDLSFEDIIAYSLEEKLMIESPRSYKDPKDVLLCKAGKAVCSISPKGDVSPCLLIPVKLGNLREQRFEEIWYQEGNEILGRLRNISAYDNSSCSQCQLLGLCYRCPGVAYVETGDLFGKSMTACRYAEWRAKLLKQDDEQIADEQTGG